MYNQNQDSRALKKYKLNSEKFRNNVLVNELISAKIINRLSNSLYVILVKNEKILANSNLDFSTQDIIVKVEAKSPKLILKLIPYYGSDYLNDILEYSNKYEIELSKFNQNFLEFLIKNKQKLNPEKFKLVSQKIVQFFNLFDNLSLLDLKNVYSFYSVDDDLLAPLIDILSNKLSLSKISDATSEPIIHDSADLQISDSDKIELDKIQLILNKTNKVLSSCHIKIKFLCQENQYKIISYLHQINNDNEKFQFLIHSELYGKFNVLAYFEDKNISLKFFTENTFCKPFLEGKKSIVKEIVKDFDYDLILAGISVVNPVSIDKGILYKL